MNWREKLNVTRRYATVNPRMAISFHDAPRAPEEFISSLKSRFPFVSNEYLEFFRHTDGMQYDVFQMFGSGVSDFSSVFRKCELWSNVAGNAVIISELADGSPIALCDDNSVRLLDPYETKNFHDGEILADSFSSFLEDVVFGPRIEVLIGRPVEIIDESEWITFLNKQGWL